MLQTRKQLPGWPFMSPGAWGVQRGWAGLREKNTWDSVMGTYEFGLHPNQQGNCWDRQVAGEHLGTLTKDSMGLSHATDVHGSGESPGAVGRTGREESLTGQTWSHWMDTGHRLKCRRWLVRPASGVLGPESWEAARKVEAGSSVLRAMLWGAGEADLTLPYRLWGQPTWSYLEAGWGPAPEGR